MLKVINGLLDFLMASAFAALVVMLSVAEGFIGFLIGMGFTFVSLIIFVFVMTFIERMTTGTWWFLDLKNK